MTKLALIEVEKTIATNAEREQQPARAEVRVTAVLNRLYDGRREAEPHTMPQKIEEVIRRNMRVGAWKG